MISLPVFESRLPVGSSASRIDGLFTSARAMATRCRCPPDSSLGRWSSREPSSTFSSAAFARACAIARRDAGVTSGSSTFCSAEARGSRVERLEHEPDLLVADLRQFVVVHLADLLAVQQVAPLVGVSRQPIRFISVDLPEPDGPMIATYSPRSI